MSKYTVVNHRMITTRWEDIEADTLEAAIQKVLDKSGEDGEEEDTDPGKFYQEGWDSEHPKVVILIRGGNLEEMYSFNEPVDFYLIDIDNVINGDQLDHSYSESVVAPDATPEEFINRFNKTLFPDRKDSV